MQLLDILILAIVFLVAALSLRYLLRHRGRCAGCRGCAGCRTGHTCPADGEGGETHADAP